MLAIETVAVLGDGESALEVALLAALSGCSVRLHHRADAALEAAAGWIRYRVDVAIEHGLLTRTDRQRILDGILFTPDLVEAAVAADLVVALGGETFRTEVDLAELAGLVRATAALAAADAGAAADLAARVPNPGRALVLTVVRDGGLARLGVQPGPDTSGHTLATASAFAARASVGGGALRVIVRVDVIPIVLEARRVVVAEVIGGFHGQASLGRWWLPSGLLADGEQPGEKAVSLVRSQLGLELEDVVVVGTRAVPVGPERHLALVLAGAVSGGEPAPGPGISGFAARTLAELPDQTGFWHRDEIALLVSRYERLRG